MKDFKLKKGRNPAGIYVYVKTPDRDVLLTDHVITDKQKKRIIEDYITQSEMRLYAYKRYRSVLNAVLLLCRDRGVGGEIEPMIEKALNQFCDLDGN